MRGRLAALLALGLLGCAGGAAHRADADRVERQLEELRRRAASDRRAVEELENRVFIVEDKLETAEIQRERVPALPVVKKPAPPPAAEPEPEPEEAASGPPIVIRLDGRERSRSSPRAEPPIDLASINEKLPVVPAPRRGAPAPRQGPDAMAAYQAAYQALGRREHAVAIRELRAFVQKWPDHDYADNAQYWLGEAYYDQADYQTALAEFRAVLKRYPDGNKAPDALLKVGFCMGKLGDRAAAREVLVEVVDTYPRSDAARLAARRLAELEGN